MSEKGGAEVAFLLPGAFRYQHVSNFRLIVRSITYLPRAATRYLST